MSDPVPAIVRLADQQLRCYNRADIDGFCDCFHEDVIVLDEHGAESMRGIGVFRERYGKLFTGFRDVWAVIDGRVTCPPHIFERELAGRTDPTTGEAATFELVVRYSERDGKIGTVQFFRGDADAR